jgi:hypothetical protein
MLWFVERYRFWDIVGRQGLPSAFKAAFVNTAAGGLASH